MTVVRAWVIIGVLDTLQPFLTQISAPTINSTNQCPVTCPPRRMTNKFLAPWTDNKIDRHPFRKNHRTTKGKSELWQTENWKSKTYTDTHTHTHTHTHTLHTTRCHWMFFQMCGPKEGLLFFWILLLQKRKLRQDQQPRNFRVPIFIDGLINIFMIFNFITSIIFFVIVVIWKPLSVQSATLDHFS